MSICLYIVTVLGNMKYYILHLLLVSKIGLELGVKATLINNSSTACPGESITFTCILPGTVLRWTVDPPPGSVFNHTQSMILTKSNQMFSVGSPGFMFQAVLTDASDGNLTSILTTVTNVSLIEGSNVTCSNATTTLVPLTINVADPPPPLNPTLSFQNGTNTSVVTLQWSPPSSPGGVDVSYVLTISPTPVSRSPVTAQNNSVGITVSYNIPYNVTIRADNCAGSGGDTVVEFELVNCSRPSAADGVILLNINTTTEGSSFMFTCSPPNSNVMETSVCGSDRNWSPDPFSYVCQTTQMPTAPPVTCGSPGSPSNGSVDVGGQSPPYPLGSMITFNCDDELFPSGVINSMCVDDGGEGVWVGNPAGLICRNMPVNCSFPREPVNSNISNYDNINTTEGSVITFQCDPGFSPVGEMTATCNNSGLWTIDPAGVMCINITNQVPLDVSTVVSSTVGSLLLIVGLFIIITAIVIISWKRKNTHSKTSSTSRAIEMNLTENFQATTDGEYSELRHGGPKKKGTKHPPPNPDEYDVITRPIDRAPLSYDDVVLDSDKTVEILSREFTSEMKKPISDGEYSKLVSDQNTQVLPGYGQLGKTVQPVTVESVIYADVGKHLKKPIVGSSLVDQHAVTYASVDIKATRKRAASRSRPKPAAKVDKSGIEADKLLNLDQTLVQLRSVQSKWKEVGEALRVPITFVEQIEASCGNDVAACMTEIVDHWMRSCSGQPTWRELADALKSVGEVQLAQQLMQIYETGRLPVELDMNDVPTDIFRQETPPPLPTRSPEADLTAPRPKQGDEKQPSRPPKPAPFSSAPPRPPKPHQ